jgi:hypothetical protein
MTISAAKHVHHVLSDHRQMFAQVGKLTAGEERIVPPLLLLHFYSLPTSSFQDRGALTTI